MTAENSSNPFVTVGMGLFSTGFKTTTSAVNLIEQLRSIWAVGVVFRLISLPLLARFLDGNWPRKDALVPYSINSSQEGE